MYNLGNGNDFCLSDVPARFFTSLNETCSSLSPQQNCSGSSPFWYVCGDQRIDVYGNIRHSDYRIAASCVNQYLRQHGCQRHDAFSDALISLFKIIGYAWAAAAAVIIIVAAGRAAYYGCDSHENVSDVDNLSGALLNSPEVNHTLSQSDSSPEMSLEN